jgi:LacI family transcriptional regulator
MGIRQIADKANVSIATVSRVLNTPDLVKKTTRDKILNIAKELGYKKNDYHVTTLKLNDEIGVVLPDVINSFFARVLEGISKKSLLLNLPINLYLTHDDKTKELEIIDKLIESGVKGVILVRSIGEGLTSLKAVKKLNKYNIPFVLVDRDIGDSSYSGVFLSNANAVYDAIHLLLSNGYQKIAIITGPDTSINSNQRLNGFKKAMSKHGISIDENMVHESDFSSQSGMEITTKMIRNKDIPEVIFSCANKITVGCIKAINQEGLTLGKDIKLFSFNKLDASLIHNFNISYIEHPVEHMGERSVIILRNKIIGTRGVIREILDYKINY